MRAGAARAVAASAVAAWVIVGASLGAAPVAASTGGSLHPLLGLPINVPPVPLPDAWSVVHDRKLHVDRPGVLANDIDADGDTLEARLSKGPAHGNLNLNHDGTFDYEPDHGFTGVDTFTYLAHDGTIGVAALVTLTVTNVAPLGVDDHYATKQGAKLQVDRPGVLKNDDDADGDTLRTKLVAGPAHGKLDLHPEGEFTYEPDPGFSGTDVFTYRATDGADQSAVVRVVIDVAPKATPSPTATPIPLPTLPLPTLPLPTILPTLPPRPTPVATPVATPDPTPKPDETGDPTPDPTRQPRPTASPPAGTGSGADPGGSAGGAAGQGPGGSPAAAPSSAPVSGSIGQPVVAPGDDFGLAHPTTDDGGPGTTVGFDAGLAAAFDGFSWQVPGARAVGPGPARRARRGPPGPRRPRMAAGRPATGRRLRRRSPLDASRRATLDSAPHREYGL